MSKGVTTRKTIDVEPREIADLSFDDDDAFPLPPLALGDPAKTAAATRPTALPTEPRVIKVTKPVETAKQQVKSDVGAKSFTSPAEKTPSSEQKSVNTTENLAASEATTRQTTPSIELTSSDVSSAGKTEAGTGTPAIPTDISPTSSRPMAPPYTTSAHACGALFAQCAVRSPAEQDRSCTKAADKVTCALPFEQPVSLAQIFASRTTAKGEADDETAGAFHKHGAELNLSCQRQNSVPVESMGNGASSKSSKVSQSPPPPAAPDATPTPAPGTADKIPEELEYLRSLLPKLKQEAKEADDKASFWEAHAHDLRRQLKLKEAEVGKLQREVHKLKSVLRQATSFGDVGPTTTPPTTALKKQGVSGESTDVSQLADDILVHHHDKDFRSKQLIKDSLMDNDFLKNLDSGQVRELVDAMYPVRFERGSYVITEGESGQHLYVAAEGEFEVMKEDKVLGRMGAGKAFGELAILYNCTRTASIRAVDHAKAWVLDRRVFQQIMMRTGLQRLEDNVNFLRSVPLLSELSHDLLAKVADVLEVEFYPEGAYIIRQGAHGDTFFIISGGCVKVTQRLPGHRDQEEEIRTLQRGDYFGEQALLNEECRTASIVALHPGVECLTLDRESFRQLIGDLQELKVKDYGDTTRVLSRPSSSFSINADHADVEFDDYHLSDLHVIATLGVGGFGRVELVQSTRDKTKTFALKCLKKKHIVDTQQQEHVFSEKAIMFGCRSPFICRLYRTFKDSKYVYMLLEACLGGEVWTILRDKGHFDDSTTRFVAGCVVEAFSYLHARGIVYRDLKPENLLLDATGYVKLVDFGFSKRLGHSAKTWTFCGTPEYVAPEIILNKGHDRAVDYWSLGVLMHELLTGTPPFVAADPMKTYNVILKGIDMVEFPRHVTRNAQGLIKLLCRDAPNERLGCQRGGLDDLRKHKWFQGFDWDGLRQRTMRVPISPHVKGPTDSGNFDAYPKDLEPTPDECSNWDADF